MGIIYWIVFGLIVGSIANFIGPEAKGGIVASIVLGILGAIVGGYLGKTFFGVSVTGFNLKSIFVAVCGALVVLIISRMLMRN
ncbi:hypothetical protein AUK40_05070 [Candidatus Wirthbacteria bacterium CG2_30_54_11]|uniref:Transglycosylase n=1 Tax=Candidatus Wirthbacteria bacterium CG2_30_54_11 TaxID=1817892 RepID=A0A1J5IH06_9BACT|nr:MAG: hypothetical protein AUK40_05070 [Candidatus Wirthbacteria bacterium CG2_30_54_11]